MNDEMVQAYARLTAHENALVLMMSHLLAQAPTAKATEFLLDYCREARQLGTDDPTAGDNPDYVRMQTDTIEISKRIADKVDRLSRALRGEQPPKEV